MPTRPLLLALAALVAAGTSLAAQPAAPKKVLSVADYDRWRTIEGAQLNASGTYAAYAMRHTNTLPADARPVVVLRDLKAGTDVTIPDASTPAFSPDGRWLTYQVEIQPRRTPTPARPDSATPAAPAAGTTGATARPTTAPTTVQRRWELRELATGRTLAWRDIASATFAPTSTHLLLRRRPADAPASGSNATTPGGNGRNNAATAPRGVDMLLVELATGTAVLLGTVGDAAFNVPGTHLAYTVDAAVRDANGLFLVTLATGAVRPLENDTLRYARLTWDHRGSTLAVLKGREVTGMRERRNTLVVYPNVATGRTPVTLAAGATSIPPNFELSDRAPLEFSEDAQRLTVGVIPQQPSPDTARRRSTDSLPDVDVWRTQDERIQSQQMIEAERDRNRTFAHVFHVGSGALVAIADSTLRDVDVPTAGSWAVGLDERPYTSDWKRPRADVYRVDLRTGARTRLLTGQLTGPHVGGLSPSGSHWLYWQGGRWHAIQLNSARATPLAPGAPSFLNTEFDYPFEKPAYGVLGYTMGDSAAVIPGRFDLWRVPLDGSAAVNLTRGVGTKEQIVFRPVRAQPIDSTVRPASRVRRELALDRPLLLSAYGEWTKKAGFYQLDGGTLTPLVYEDASFTAPLKARDADVLLFTRQTFREFPDLRVAGPTLADSKVISNANPQQAEYRWGSRVLFDYVTRRGVKLQGVLALPDDYRPGQKLPMLVTFYEKNSQTMHRYPTPSLLTGMGGMPVEAVSRGYATMLPDVHFHTGSSHSDMLDAVEAATRKVIAMGYVDPKRIGVHGHSYGGEGAAFIGVKSSLFAAVGMGAGVTDLFSDFSQSWGWTYDVRGGSGENGNGYYMTGQGRWGVSPWDDPERFRNESALPFAHQAKAPFLIMHGTADPTVSFTEGMNFYNALRFNGKEAVMLAYPGEGHGLRGLANRRDLTGRYFEYFDHFLRGGPAPAWMTQGVPYLVKDRPAPPPPRIIP
jgi:hypothetical protein